MIGHHWPSHQSRDRGRGKISRPNHAATYHTGEEDRERIMKRKRSISWKLRKFPFLWTLLALAGGAIQHECIRNTRSQFHREICCTVVVVAPFDPFGFESMEAVIVPWVCERITKGPQKQFIFSLFLLLSKGGIDSFGEEKDAHLGICM